MRFKNWLLAGTSIGFMAFAPLSTMAQDDTLRAAYQALLAAEASGDAAALEAARNSFTELCIIGGYSSIEDCVAVLNVPAPAPEPQPEVIPEPAPEPTPEPVVEEPVVEPQQEPAPVVEEPPPQQIEEPAAMQVEEPAPEPEPQPVIEEPAPEPVVTEQPVIEQPAEVQPAATPGVDYAALLAAQVAAYDAAIAELLAGGNIADIQPRLDAASSEIAALCAESGQPDVTACLGQYGLELPTVPGLPQQPVIPAEQAPVEQPVAEQPEPLEEVTVDGQIAEPITELPAGVTVEQIAPVLDSVKDEPADAAPVAQNTEPPQPPPVSDEAAQSEAVRAFAVEPLAAAAETGTVVTATDNTTVNQTVINNYITNITNNTVINNTTTNTTNNTTNNIGQQNNVTVVQAPTTVRGNSGDVIAQVILQIGTQLVVNSIGQDTDRFYDQRRGDEIYYENLSNGRVREVITRPDGSQIITVRNRNGDVLRRSRITPDGREYVLATFDDRYDRDLVEWRDPGASLPPLRLNIPVRDYVLDARYANERELETFFRQPPVEQVARLYSIDEVKRSARVRDSVRKLEVGNLTFDSGKATIASDQVRSLSAVANAMLALLDRNPGETFLIEGHTDAVGSDISNLGLSDLRAATVARILTDFYGVPPENLATQGYGERYLKIRTEAAERENRRVTIRRITPLITVAGR